MGGVRPVDVDIRTGQLAGTMGASDDLTHCELGIPQVDGVREDEDGGRCGRQGAGVRYNWSEVAANGLSAVRWNCSPRRIAFLARSAVTARGAVGVRGDTAGKNATPVPAADAPSSG